MKQAFFSRLAFGMALVCAGLFVGCGQKDVSLTPVSGKVTVDGTPLTKGSVSLVLDVPLGNKGAEEASKMQAAGLSGGEIGPDGTYKIFTGGKEGAPIGKYKVRVLPPVNEMQGSKDGKETPKIGFKKEYTDANKTPLKYEVSNSPKAGQYDLKLTK